MSFLKRLFGGSNSEGPPNDDESRDKKIVAEMKALMMPAKVAVAHERIMGVKVSKAGLVEEIEYIADRVRPKYGLTEEHFSRLFTEAWEEFWSKK